LGSNGVPADSVSPSLVNNVVDANGVGIEIGIGRAVEGDAVGCQAYLQAFLGLLGLLRGPEGQGPHGLSRRPYRPMSRRRPATHQKLGGGLEGLHPSQGLGDCDARLVGRADAFRDQGGEFLATGEVELSPPRRRGASMPLLVIAHGRWATLLLGIALEGDAD